MHRLWRIPELLVQVVSFLPPSDIDRAFVISHHFRTTLKANLPPHLHRLPDHSPKIRDQALPQDVRDKARDFGIHDAALPEQMKMTDSYYYWYEDARCQVLNALAPCLHPVLRKYTTYLIDGYEFLAEGKLSVFLQTDIPYRQLYSLLHEKANYDNNEFLAVSPPTMVTVFCVGGLDWDSSYANVQFRDYGATKRLSIKVEREDGIRIGDVLDELRGTLDVDGMSGGLGQDVVLVWDLDDRSSEEIVSNLDLVVGKFLYNHTQFLDNAAARVSQIDKDNKVLYMCLADEEFKNQVLKSLLETGQFEASTYQDKTTSLTNAIGVCHPDKKELQADLEWF